MNDSENKSHLSVDPRKRVDLRAKKNNPEWAAAWGPLFISLAPKLFEWVGWIFLLGGIRYVGEATGLTALRVLDVSLTLALLFYFIEFFYRFEVVGLPFMRGKPALLFFTSVLISVGIGYLFYMGADAIADQISAFETQQA